MITGKTGFILTAESLDINGRCELRFYGSSPEGPFLAVINPHKPLFFIKRSCPSGYTNTLERKPVEMSDFDGNPVDAVYFNSLADFFEARRFLSEKNITLYESDIRAEECFLMERFINSSVYIDGSPVREGNLDVFRNPVIKRGRDFRPDLQWLSLDIETGKDGTLYSVSFHLTRGRNEIKHVLIRGNPGDSGAEWITYCGNEKDLLIRFVEMINRYDPDIIIGWHVIGFDLGFLERRAAFYGIPLEIGRGHKPLKTSENRRGLYSAVIEGRIVIDGPQALRTAFYSFDSYSLEDVSQVLLGRGKDIAPESDKVAEIERRFIEDKESLAFYNLEDSVLVTEIFRKTAIIDQLVTRSLITGLQVDRVNMSVAAFDHFILPLFHRKGYAAPDVRDIKPGESASGGYVFTSDPGLYINVAVFDFKSLYPTIIRTFFIDPLSRLKSDIDTVYTPSGTPFSGSQNILPGLLEDLMAKREAAKKNGDEYLSQAVKILMNSFYGVMGTAGCRFYHPDLPAAITETGQWILKTASAYLKGMGYSVIYGDTDSVFVLLKHEEYENPRRSGALIADMINNYFTDLLIRDYRVESLLEIEFEKNYEKFLLPPVRYSNEGARKRYAGLLENGVIEYKGLETVRSDWTDLAKNFQQELFRRFFSGEELDGWIKGYVGRLKNGEFDSMLVYRKRLSRYASEYVKNHPPHVKAALKLDPEGGKRLRKISYIMTSEGATPVEMFEGNADYRHYIEKQLRPVADGVLFAAGKDFDSILEGKQLDLF